ncbi:PHA/PHB synthase family protein [Castellaniella denitrificans]|uniref:PHA/PHB synthase family protein n=1 Tax=Castellaniella denitrificans TaxID=56119 RepID=UPI0038B3C5F0
MGGRRRFLSLLFPFETTVNDASYEAAAPAHCAPPHADSSWERIDRVAFATVAKLSGGLSPFGMAFAHLDWAAHMACSPGKALALWQLLLPGQDRDGTADPAGTDRRFKHPGWENQPYRQWRDQFLKAQAFWDQATRNVDGVQPHHLHVQHFITRQLLDTASPSNLWWTNPEVLAAARDSAGMNFVHGGLRMLADWKDLLAGDAPGTSPQALSAYRVGKEIAATPGQVVFRNELFELIRYAPATDEAWREPVLIVPSWLLKYYILDLSAHNSLIRHLVYCGHTVFAMSWRNPDAEARDTGLEDYLERGVLRALSETARGAGCRRVHAVGYCLGGTLLALCAAALAREPRQDVRLQTMTLLAAQTDFSEPGELGLFMGTSAVAFLDGLMWQQGYLDGVQLAGVFQLLNARDLIWSRLVREYLLGHAQRVTDMMAWNADTTRLPYRLHSETLRYLYHGNDLAEGRYCWRGAPVSLSDLRVPAFVVATERDHISPWKSVYKLHRLCAQDLSFVLASGGHNGGIVAPPGQAHAQFRLAQRKLGQSYRSPESWMARTPIRPGSWWPAWEAWLTAHSSVRVPVQAVAQAHTLCAAPGTYVFNA